MDNNNGKDTFNYTYSAKQQQEINDIRKKYLAPEQDKMEQLRRLDASVTRKGTTVSLILGIVGVLFLGLGMSLAMTNLGEILGSYSGIAMPIGIIIGIVGIILLALAYPLYNHITAAERRRLAPEILRLTDELMK
ncbi:MAG: hypothetical protein IJY27_06440 [Clostridia bacterium]|nr:hypothetical protein [Clostridia bacterium]